MKPKLVIGLGNPLMGDEGVGYHVVGRLLGHPRLPPDAEVIWGGTDLLRHVDSMEGRGRIIVVDAVLDDSEPGVISVLEHGFPEPQKQKKFENSLECGDRQNHAHHLSLIQAIDLARLGSESLPAARVTVVGITIASASAGPDLSPTIDTKLVEIVDLVLEMLDASETTAGGD